MERGCSTVVCLFIFTTIHLWAFHAADEAGALHAFKNALIDPHHTLDIWALEPSHPCEWFHVNCSGTGKVIELDLGGLHLSGPLVKDLADLTELQTLYLYGNELYGPIPPEFGKLANLVMLDLHDNNLNDTIPAELGKLPNLANCWLNNNKFKGELPKTVLDLAAKLKDNFSVANNPGLCGKYALNPVCL